MRWEYVLENLVAKVSLIAIKRRLFTLSQWSVSRGSRLTYVWITRKHGCERVYNGVFHRVPGTMITKIPCLIDRKSHTTLAARRFNQRFTLRRSLEFDLNGSSRAHLFSDNILKDLKQVCHHTRLARKRLPPVERRHRALRRWRVIVVKPLVRIVGSLDQCLSTGCIVHTRVYQNFPGVYQLHSVYRGVPDVCSSKTVNCPTYILCSSAVCELFTFFKTVYIGWCALCRLYIGRVSNLRGLSWRTRFLVVRWFFLCTEQRIRHRARTSVSSIPNAFPAPRGCSVASHALNATVEQSDSGR